MQIPAQVTHRELLALFRARQQEHAEYLTALHAARDVEGYVSAARAFDVEMAGHVPLLLQAFGAVVGALEDKQREIAFRDNLLNQAHGADPKDD